MGIFRGSFIRLSKLRVPANIRNARRTFAWSIEGLKRYPAFVSHSMNTGAPRQVRLALNVQSLPMRLQIVRRIQSPTVNYQTTTNESLELEESWRSSKKLEMALQIYPPRCRPINYLLSYAPAINLSFSYSTCFFVVSATTIITSVRIQLPFDTTFNARNINKMCKIVMWHRESRSTRLSR